MIQPILILWCHDKREHLDRKEGKLVLRRVFFKHFKHRICRDTDLDGSEGGRPGKRERGGRERRERRKRATVT